jgi:hypothetical protein
MEGYINMNLDVVGWEGLGCVGLAQEGCSEHRHELSGCVKFGIS